MTHVSRLRSAEQLLAATQIQEALPEHQLSVGQALAVVAVALHAIDRVETSAGDSTPVRDGLVGATTHPSPHTQLSAILPYVTKDKERNQ